MNKRFLSIAASTAIVASALVFTGCGDSGSSSAAATTSSGTTSGTSTATFFKGAWSGVSYTASSGQSSTTATGGNFTYSGDANVTFDLGLLDLKFTNVTALKTNGVIYAAQGTSGNTNATVSSTEIGNLLAVLAPFGINETGASTTNMARLSTMLTALKALKAQDPATYNATNTLMDTNKVTIGLAAKTGVANTTIAMTAADAYATYAAAAAANMQSSGANVANLNASFLSNKAIFLSDGTILAMNGTMLGSTNGSLANFLPTAISLAGNPDEGGREFKTSNSSNATVANVSTWSASGAFINLTPGGVNNTVAFNGPFAKGTTVTVTNGTGYMRTLTVAGIGYNLVPALKAANMNGSTDIGTFANRSIGIGGTTYTLESFNRTNGNAAGKGLGRVFINGTDSGFWNLTNTTYGYAINLTNATGTGVNQTVAFADDITTSTGVVATIWNTVSNSVSTLIAAFLNLVSTTSKLI